VKFLAVGMQIRGFRLSLEVLTAWSGGTVIGAKTHRVMCQSSSTFPGS
jgi:hypothetical protein